MDSIIQERCDLFIQNKNNLKSVFKLESTYMYPLCALLYTFKNAVLDAQSIKCCKGMIKRETRLFSNFRGTGMLPISTMLSLSRNAERLMESGIKVHKFLKQSFMDTAFLPVTAMIIAVQANEYDYERIAKRTREIYLLMKEAHPLLTSGEDTAFAALLAMSDLSNSQIASEMGKCYKLLNEEFRAGNNIQTLSHILALDTASADEKCRNIIELSRKLTARGYKFGAGYEMSTLGVLLLSKKDFDLIVEEISEIEAFLLSQRDFGAWGIGKKERLMYAGMLSFGGSSVLDLTGEDKNATVAAVVAEQAAMCAAIAAATSATAAATAASTC